MLEGNLGIPEEDQGWHASPAVPLTAVVARGEQTFGDGVELGEAVPPFLPILIVPDARLEMWPDLGSVRHRTATPGSHFRQGMGWKSPRVRHGHSPTPAAGITKRGQPRDRAAVAFRAWHGTAPSTPPPA